MNYKQQTYYYTIININPGKSIPIKVIDNHFPTFANKLSLYLIDNISAGIKNINEVYSKVTFEGENRNNMV